MATQTFSRVLVKGRMMEKNGPRKKLCLSGFETTTICMEKLMNPSILGVPNGFVSRLGILWPLAASFWSLGKQWALS